jgi:hypothetical protein
LSVTLLIIVMATGEINLVRTTFLLVCRDKIQDILCFAHAYCCTNCDRHS